MAVLLEDRQAHPALWHVAAAQCLTGKAFRNYYDVSFTRTRPKDWVAFQIWLTKLSPLGATLQGVAAKFASLRQGRDETCQSFYERFRDWESKAKSIDFAYEEKTSFVKRLNPGLSAKVIEVMDNKHVRGTPMEMDQVLLTALVNDQRYRQGKAARASAAPSRGLTGSERRRRVLLPVIIVKNRVMW
jgi:hypothetical protein